MDGFPSTENGADFLRRGRLAVNRTESAEEKKARNPLCIPPVRLEHAIVLTHAKPNNQKLAGSGTGVDSTNAWSGTMPTRDKLAGFS